MKRYMCAVLLCAAALAVSAALLPPTYARQPSTAVWTAELKPTPETEEIEIKSDLLVPGGQTVLLAKNEPYTIELNLWAEELADKDLTTDILIDDNSRCKAEINKSTEKPNVYVLTVEKSDSEDDDVVPSAMVTWNYKDTAFSATFMYADDAAQISENSDAATELNGLPKQFNENIPVSFTVGADNAELTMKDGAPFPAGTRYTVKYMTYVLYDESTIRLEGGDMCSIDFSMTDVRSDIILCAGDCTADIAYIPFPALDGSGPFIMTGAAVELPVSFMWGDIGPSVKIYRLIQSEDGITWQEDSKVTAQTSDTGNVQLTSGTAPAGTYKIEINWHGSHTIETNFYIRYNGIGEEVLN